MEEARNLTKAERYDIIMTTLHHSFLLSLSLLLKVFTVSCWGEWAGCCRFWQWIAWRGRKFWWLNKCMHQCMHASHYCHVRLTIIFKIYTLRLSSFIIPPPSLSLLSPRLLGPVFRYAYPLVKVLQVLWLSLGRVLIYAMPTRANTFTRRLTRLLDLSQGIIITINCIVQKIQEKFFLPNFKPQFKSLFHLYFKWSDF